MKGNAALLIRCSNSMLRLNFKLSALDDLGDIWPSDASSSDTSRVKVSGTTGSAIEGTHSLSKVLLRRNRSIFQMATAPKPSA